jgi:hypothetical protein
MRRLGSVRNWRRRARRTEFEIAAELLDAFGARSPLSSTRCTHTADAKRWRSRAPASDLEAVPKQSW